MRHAERPLAAQAEEGAGLGAAEGSRTARVAAPPRHPGRLKRGRGFCREDQSCVAARGSWPRLLKGPQRGLGGRGKKRKRWKKGRKRRRRKRRRRRGGAAGPGHGAARRGLSGEGGAGGPALQDTRVLGRGPREGLCRGVTHHGSLGALGRRGTGGAPGGVSGGLQGVWGTRGSSRDGAAPLLQDRSGPFNQYVI